MVPWRLMSVASLAASYFLTPRTTAWPVAHLAINALIAMAAQLFVWAAWEVVLYPKLFSPLRHLPEPPGNSLFMGQYPRIAAEPSGAPMVDWINSVDNDGVIRYLGFLNQERILLTSPKALSEVLVSKAYEFPKPIQLLYLIGRILGIGLLLAEGDEHKKQRKSLQPAFSFRHVKDLYPIFWDKSAEGVRAMTEQVALDVARASENNDCAPADKLPEGTVYMEAGRWASRITLDIIGVAGLGRDFGAIRDPDNEINKTYARVFQSSNQARITSLLSMFFPAWLVSLLPVQRNEDIGHAAKLIRATCRDLVHEKRAKLADRDKKHAELDVLSVALASSVFSDEGLVDQMMTFLAAGHETTAAAMTWAVYLLCLHPQVQTRLRAEVREHLPSPGSGASVTSADIDSLPYLSAVYHEVLRYLTPVPFTHRVASRDTTILGHPVRRGTSVMISPWAVNRSVDLWGPDAMRFDPDRWLPRTDGDKAAASGGATSNYAFSTFLHGPRGCIGAGFAKAELACLLAAWVGRFEFALRYEAEMDEKNMDIKGGITSRPANGLHIKVKVLEGW